MSEKFKIELKPETIRLIEAEINSIPEKFHKPFSSNHEGYAVLLEEVELLKYFKIDGTTPKFNDWKIPKP